MDNNKHKTHMFPIENRDKYKAYIKFTPIIKNGPTYQSRVNIPQTEAQSSSDTAKSFLENAFNQFGNSAISASTERRGDESVALYMPTPVTIQDGVSIEPASLGILGEGASRSMDEVDAKNAHS